MWLLFWQAFCPGGTSPQIEAEEAEAPASLVYLVERSFVCSTSLPAPEGSVEQYAIAATRKNSRCLHLYYEYRSKTSNTYPRSQPGESKSSNPANVFSANTTKANFTNAVNAAHAPRTG